MDKKNSRKKKGKTKNSGSSIVWIWIRYSGFGIDLSSTSQTYKNFDMSLKVKKDRTFLS